MLIPFIVVGLVAFGAGVLVGFWIRSSYEQSQLPAAVANGRAAGRAEAAAEIAAAKEEVEAVKVAKRTCDADQTKRLAAFREQLTEARARHEAERRAARAAWTTIETTFVARKADWWTASPKLSAAREVLVRTLGCDRASAQPESGVRARGDGAETTEQESEVANG